LGWSQDDKARIVEETLAPGAKVTEVARRNAGAAIVVFTWRRQARTVERVGPFWSVSMYDRKSRHLINNPINRYLNAPMLAELKKNADGSLSRF
jgi:transposase-like protein